MGASLHPGRVVRVGSGRSGTDQPAPHGVTRTVFSQLTRFISCLHQRREITLLVEVMHDCLLHCLSHDETWNGRSHPLQLLWSEILNSLSKAQPPFVFNSKLLKFQAALLQKALNHPNPSISEPTIKFWNSTYGKQLLVDYPQCLLFVLDKLSKAGKISLFKQGASVLQKCLGAQQLSNSGLTTGKGIITTTNNRNSKRVELVGKDTMGPECSGSKSKRTKLELTEHQREVRRAQQGKERDCNGHGPGIRTYTSLDFSQSNDNSQELEDVRNAESILEMLKRPH
uniref:Uncharacterized protein n=1 Tax=Kalanchoe fedtschenkoi TaxID=63787 RepID=A0A7N0U838_KALFE